jgi:hypothetical protein
MDVFTTSATAVSVLAAIVTILSKFAAARVERRRDHTIADVKWWAGSEDGRHWIRGYVAEWVDEREVRQEAREQRQERREDRQEQRERGGGGGGRNGGGISGGISGGSIGGDCSTDCNDHGYLDRA